MVKKTIEKAQNVKAFKGWKTLAFNGLASVLPIASVVGQIAAIPELQGLVPSDYWPAYLGAVTVGNAVLRAVTNTPVGSKY